MKLEELGELPAARGEVLVTGTPEEVAQHPTSHTGRYLSRVLQQHPPEIPVAIAA